jgi:hypothetical protein
MNAKEISINCMFVYDIRSVSAFCDELYDDVGNKNAFEWSIDSIYCLSLKKCLKAIDVHRKSPSKNHNKLPHDTPGAN